MSLNMEEASYEEIIQYLHNNRSLYSDEIMEQILPLSNDSDVNLGESFMKDLEIFVDYNNDKDQSIFEHIVGCQTTMGRHITKHIWSNPISNINRLKDRQKLVELLQHLNIQSRLRRIHSNESNIFLLTDPDPDKREGLNILKNIVLFNYPWPSWLPSVNDILNSNKLLLTGTCLYREYLNPAHITLSPIIPIIFPFIMMRFAKLPIDPKMYLNIIKNQFISDGGIFKYIFGNKSTITTIGALCLTTLWIFLYFYNIYTAWKYSNTVKDTIKKFRQHWLSYKSLVEVSNDIYEMIPNEAWPMLESEFNMSKHRMAITLGECMYLFPKDETYEKLLERGSLIKIYNEMMQLIENNTFQTLFYWIGLMDYHQWIHYMVGLGRFKYAKYRENTSLKIKGCIHPYLINPISNNVIFNKNRAMLISGPNAGGKSTYMKSVAIHLLFVQTMGFAPGEVTLTPYESIDTYLHIPDCKGRESLFQAEMNRCIDFLDKVHTGKRSFMMMDEIFTSTNVTEGIEAAHHILNRLISYPNLTLMVTTHFEDLQKLEQETNGAILNYYVDIKRLSNKIIFTYKIYRGITTERVALDLIAAKLQKTNILL